MALPFLQVDDIVSQVSEGDSFIDMFKDIETSPDGSNRALRLRMDEVIGMIHSQATTYFENTNFAYRGYNSAGQALDIMDQAVQTVGQEINNSIGFYEGKPVDRVVELPMDVELSMGLTGIVLCGVERDVDFMGRNVSPVLSADIDKRDIGVTAVVSDHDNFTADRFAVGTFLKYFATNEQKNQAHMRMLERCTLQRSLPVSVGSADDIPDAIFERDFLPTIGQSKLNKTAPLTRYFVGGGSKLSDITPSNTLSVNDLDMIEDRLKAIGATGIAIEPGQLIYGLMCTSRQSQHIVNSLGDDIRDIINISQTGSQNWESNPLYKYSFKEHFPGYKQFMFFYNDLLTSNPTVLEYTDESGNPTTSNVADTIDLRTKKRLKNFQGTALNPRTVVKGLITGDTDLSLAKVQFAKKTDVSDVADGLKNGTWGADDLFLVVDEKSAINLSFHHDKTSRKNIGQDDVTSIEVDASVAGSVHSTLNAGDYVGEIQLGETYNLGSNVTNDKKWRILYTGPHPLGTFSKTTSASQHLEALAGQNEIGIAMVMRIQAIYRWDEANSTWETDRVADGDMAAELDAIRTNLVIDATDGFVRPLRDANGDFMEQDGQLAYRRSANYFNVVRGLAFGSDILIRAIPTGLAPISGEEDRFFKLFTSSATWTFVGHSLAVDRLSRTPKGGVEVFAYEGIF